MGKFIDLTGKQFGHLAVIEQAENKNGRVMWLCKCDCGTVKPIASSNLIHGYSTTCGCGQRHCGIDNNSYKHGKSKTKLYSVWKAMRQRCNNPNNYDYQWYGAEGKKICDEWDNYIEFEKWAMSSGYKSGLTIDRIDSSSCYCPENCRWITIQEQQKNKRNVRRLSLNGETHTISEWSEIKGIPYRTILGRIHNGWSSERALGGQDDKK